MTIAVDSKGAKTRNWKRLSAMKYYVTKAVSQGHKVVIVYSDWIQVQEEEHRSGVIILGRDACDALRAAYD